MTATPDNAVPDPQQIIAELQRKLDESRAELAARNSAYSERIAYQGAANDVLKVMSASPGDPQPVFDLISVRARDICDAYGVTVCEFDGSLLHWRAATGISEDPAIREAAKAAFPTPPTRDMAVGRAILNRAIVHIRDHETEPGLRRFSLTVKSSVVVPLMRGDLPIGTLQMGSRERGGFSNTQVELLKTFAEQAVIAIGSAETYRALQTRTTDLRESLQVQTATSDVLKIISSSLGELEPVFRALLENAVHLCEAEFGMLFLFEENEFRAVGKWNLPLAYSEFLRKNTIGFDPRTPVGRAAITKQPVQVADILVDQSYIVRHPGIVAVAEDGGARTLLQVPMLKESELVGTIGIYRQEVRPFSDKQIALVQSFAAQAVIAIENARLLNELRARTDDLGESLQQQTATADVLEVISRSAFDLNPVFETVAESSVRLCGSDRALIFRFDGELLRVAAAFNAPDRLMDWLERNPIRPGRYSVGARAALERQTIHVQDVLADTEHTYGAKDVEPFRTVLGVPMLKGDDLLGVIMVYHNEVRPFTDKQIALIQTFADQAVIAIENARLFNETTEALERQTATANILKVIAGSPTDVQPVFDAIAESAKRLLGSHTAVVTRVIDDVIHLAASTAESEAPAHAAKGLLPYPLSSDRIHARVARTGQVAVNTDAPNSDLPQEIKEFARTVGWRSLLVVPMLRNEIAIGTIGITRREPGSFDDKTVDLLKTFADQAVIAIENARLFNETKKALRELEVRSSELTESLEHQTATSQILGVISSSKADIQPVFDAIVDSAARLFEPCGATITTLKEGKLRWNASAATLPDFDIDRAQAIYPIPFDPERSPSARALLERRIIEIPDVAAPDTPEFTRKAAAAGGFQSATFVPLIKQEKGIGTIILTHLRAGFRLSEKQLALVSTFADQAVIAIENARLFNETKEALERQTATADILKVIASSPSDVQPVFQAIADQSNRLVDALSTTVFRLVDGIMHLRAFTPTTPEADATLQAMFPAPLSTFSWGESIRRGEIYRVIDTEHEPADLRDLARLRGWRSCLCVPLLRDGELIGMIGPTRAEPGPFADHHVQLLQTFADQAVIAISNVKLFNEVQERTRELSASLDDLRTAQDRLVQTEKLASLGQLTAGIAHEIKNPLNFVNNFSALSAELIDELDEILAPAPLDQKMRGDVGERTQMLKSNLEKVVEHGKRADSIVKNMLLHSREGSGEQRSADINALVEESLNLAYHGARAEKPGFNVSLKRDLDPDAGAAELYPQEITRALLNLISNGFYAAIQRKSEEGETFEPVLIAATKNLGKTVEIRIRDNGAGIPEGLKEKIFNPFFTTKPSGEGTGLGLSMSHDIIVKQHGGSIDVETEPGLFTEFKIVLPRTSQR